MELVSQIEYLKKKIINEKEVQILYQLSISDSLKPRGPDGLSLRILKATRLSMHKPLTKIFNISLKNKSFPYISKQAYITPVFRNIGDPEPPDKYRSTSAVCNVKGKIL